MSLLGPNLEAFQAVVQRTTVHGAASDLGITQTGVTQRIRSLENQLSTTLFIRSRKGMLLTSEGEALLRYCQAARDLEGETLAKLDASKGQDPVRLHIAGPTSIMRSRTVPAVATVIRRISSLLITFQITDLSDRADLLRRGDAQIAILEPEHVTREMDSRLLKAERYILVGPSNWKRRPIKDIVKSERIIDFDPSDTMTHHYLKKFDLIGLARTERHFVNNTESLIDLIREGVGYGVLTHEFAAPYLKSNTLCVLNGGKIIENRLAVAWYPRHHVPKYFSETLKAIL